MNNNTRKKITAGLLAHVDSGKTTLSEGLLYISGVLSRQGRVDSGDTFLDTDPLEISRGITIFSKQARLSHENVDITLLDTPGHVDFSAEMERVLRVLDYGILIINASDGIQGHTLTLWELLGKYRLPCFIFINKMDLADRDRLSILAELKEGLDDSLTDFSDTSSRAFFEDIASLDEDAMEDFFAGRDIDDEKIGRMIWDRQLFPCYFGSALKMEGIEELLSGISRFTIQRTYPVGFGARVFKISRDDSGLRLTHVKITGGTVRTRDLLSGRIDTGRSRITDSSATDADIYDTEETWSEKITQIRFYNGDKFTAGQEACAGDICTLTGLGHTFPGEGLGFERSSDPPVLEAVLSREIILPEGMDIPSSLPKFRLLDEELPELKILWNRSAGQLQVRAMGEVQMEVLKDIILQRFRIDIAFGTTKTVYRETIASPVEGVGHFEPLRHYAEVHLWMEPLPRGSGLIFDTACSEDILDKNYQKLILTHLGEKEHLGVLTGSPLTDVRITLITGKAHKKHTEGGDFRQATYRAVRQGLMETESILLEPYYNFRLELPEGTVGRAMTDIERMGGSFDAPISKGSFQILTGSAPVSAMQDYSREVSTYTRGFGRLSLFFKDFEPCSDQEAIVFTYGYDPEKDVENSPDSVFCSHGAGYIVPWQEVKAHMHLESPFSEDMNVETEEEAQKSVSEKKDYHLGTEEVDAIISSTYTANMRRKPAGSRWSTGRPRTPAVQQETRVYKPMPPREKYLLVDGYNIIHAWPHLRSLSERGMDAARGMLMDELCNYQGFTGINIIIVFDAYRVAGHQTEIFDYNNIHVVFTKEAETADQYIEKFAHEHGKKYDISVATSDGLEQVIIRGAGCRLLSATDLTEELDNARLRMREIIEIYHLKNNKE